MRRVVTAAAVGISAAARRARAARPTGSRVFGPVRTGGMVIPLAAARRRSAAARHMRLPGGGD